MAKIAAAKANLSVNAVALEGELNDISLDIKQEVIKVDGFTQSGPEKVVGNYDWSFKLAGNSNFSSGQGDATVFALLGSAGVAQDFDPTGAVAAANNPHYTGTVVLEDYSIKAAVGAATKYSVGLSGASALTRAVT